MNYKQPRKTIKSKLEVRGIEFHTGQSCRLSLSPASRGTGIQLHCNGTSAEAKVENLALAHRGTTSIEVGQTVISSVEHLLSALYGEGITDIYIDILQGTELPIIDGSAKFWVAQIDKVGIRLLSGTRHRLRLSQPFEFAEGISRYTLTPNDSLNISVEIDFPKTIIGNQSASFDSSKESYRDKVAWARTFIADGAHGAKLDRIKVLTRLKSVDIDKPKTSPCILYEQMRYITPLRQHNEPAVHKLLDFMGDLSLLGGMLEAQIRVICPSHNANHLLVRKILTEGLVS